MVDAEEEITKLKNEARKFYVLSKTDLDEESIKNCKDNFNKVMEKLVKLDPEAPDFRM
jgi:hypothetical protein